MQYSGIFHEKLLILLIYYYCNILQTRFSYYPNSIVCL